MKKTIILSLAGFLVVFGYIMVLKGFYPVVFVGYHPILAFEFDENVKAAKQFYQTQGLVRPDLKIDWANDDGKRILKEIKNKVILTMIENKIIDSVLNEEKFRGVFEDADKKVAAVLAEQEISPDFTEGIKLLYGWDLKNFKERILIPQARQELIKEKLKSENINFDNWFLEKKRNSGMIIFFIGKFNKETGQVE